MIGVLAVAIAFQAQAELPPRDAFHVACGERLCRLLNRYSEFEVTRGDVRVQRLLAHGPGDRLRLRVTPPAGDRPDTVPLVMGRGVGNLVTPLSRAARIAVEDCQVREDERSPTADPCLINLDGLDSAIETARTRLTVARRRW